MASVPDVYEIEVVRQTPARHQAALGQALEPEYTMHEVVALTGLSEHTLRYYERVGLIQPVRRHPSSRHRRYHANDLAKLETMACLRAAGMPIDQMRHYFELVPDGAPHEKRALLEAHQQVLEQRMRQLENHLEYLQRKIAYWCAVEADDKTTADVISQDIGRRLHTDILHIESE